MFVALGMKPQVFSGMNHQKLTSLRHYETHSDTTRPLSPNSPTSFALHGSRNLDPQLKLKLQRLETQKRAALDSEETDGSGREGKGERREGPDMGNMGSCVHDIGLEQLFLVLCSNL